MKITRFISGTKEYTFANVQDWRANFADLVPRTKRLPYADGGVDLLGDGRAPAAIGMVQINFIIAADEDPDGMTALVDAAKEMADWGRGRLYLQPSDPTGDERWCSARVNNIGTPYSERRQSRIWQRVKLVFQVSDPHWYDVGTESWLWGDGSNWGSVLWGGDAPAPQAVSGTQTDFTITTAGNATTFPRIIVSCGSGQSAADVSVQRVVQDEVLDEVLYSALLSDGDQLVINCRELAVRLNGSDAYGPEFTFAHASWLRLLPGTNNMRVLMANSADAASLTFKYYEAYR